MTSGNLGRFICRIAPFLTVLTCIAFGYYVATRSGERLEQLTNQGRLLRASRLRNVTHSRGIIILGWADNSRKSTNLRDAVLRDCGNIAKFASFLDVYVDEPVNAEYKHSALNIFPLTPPVSVHIAIEFKDIASQNTDDKEFLQRGEELVRFNLPSLSGLKQTAVYVVDRSVYTEYGEYDGPAQIGWDAKRKKDWAIGSKSPFIVAHTCFPRLTQHSSLSSMEWAEQVWWSRQSPMSEMIQPRARYVRNVVLESSKNSPPLAGIVIESWPSKTHMDDPFLFFAATTIEELIVHVTVMVRSVLQFTDIMKLQGVILSEYIF